jgi:predicted nucleotidyltransferase
MNVPLPKEQLAAFCQANHVRRLSIFGSALRLDFNEQSDVDVLVEFEPDHVPGLFGIARMERELSALFGGRQVDLRTQEDLSRHFSAAGAGKGRGPVCARMMPFACGICWMRHGRPSSTCKAKRGSIWMATASWCWRWSKMSRSLQSDLLPWGTYSTDSTANGIHLLGPEERPASHPAFLTREEADGHKDWIP